MVSMSGRDTSWKAFDRSIGRMAGRYGPDGQVGKADYLAWTMRLLCGRATPRSHEKVTGMRACGQASQYWNDGREAAT